MVMTQFRVKEDVLQSFLDNPASFEDYLALEENLESDSCLDLGKLWEGIYYMLTGEGISDIEEPTVLSRSLFSLQVLDEDQDLGYGPAHFLNVAQVEETVKALNKRDFNSEIYSINGSEMMEKEIYPSVWVDKESIDYLKETFSLFLLFYRKAAENKEATISVLM